MVSPVSDRNVVSVTAFDGMRDVMQAALGVELPETPVGVVQDGILWLWSGPKSWLAISEKADLAARLEAAAGDYAAVVDQSDGKFLVRVNDERARENLQKLVGIDLHESAFAENATALTLAAHIPVQIWRANEKFELACFRSYAPGLAHALTEALR